MYLADLLLLCFAKYEYFFKVNQDKFLFYGVKYDVNGALETAVRFF